MTNSKPTVGSVVNLRSGGAKMTISKVIPYTDEYVCVWLNASGDLQMGIFGGNILQFYK